ncbi:hypothetical protein VSAK1_26135 [Vibrio mediterranei AK1]|uniref:hypothetical protein n=1 Tax=Vibrio mediterranei TaxID=689 RepID=UPI0001540F1D|nr:hypothetical protein [Vibrio mediterranei]EDL53721.1 hypothetical protein VSAK1_26135 [Vibrio mediterranei AK1]
MLQSYVKNKSKEEQIEFLDECLWEIQDKLIEEHDYNREERDEILFPKGYLGVNKDRTLVRYSILFGVFNQYALWNCDAAYKVWNNSGANAYCVYFSDLFIDYVESKVTSILSQ